MKLFLKRLICIIIVVMLCFSSLHIVNIFATDEPELSAKCETLIDITGKEGSFGTAASALRTSTAVKLPSAINLSNADVFEFDVYIEDIDALQAVFADSWKVNFGFSSNARVNTANRADANISKQLVDNGWNHIEINKSDFEESNINWATVRHYYIKFIDESAKLPNDLHNKTIKIKNLCESFAIPELADGDVVLFDYAVFGKLGEDENSSLSYIGETFNTGTYNSDLSDSTFLKLELLIPSLSEFNAFVANKDFKFVLFSNSGVAEYIFDGAYFPSTVSSWYTVQVPVGDFVQDNNFDITSVTGFKIEIEGADGATVGSAFASSFGFANVRGIDYPFPEGDITFGEVVEDYGISKKVVEFGSTYGDFTFSLDSDFNALNESENVEFDLYLENLDGFKNFFIFDKNNNPVNASLDLTLSNGGNTLKWTGIEDKILAKGWNHIILSIADAQNNGFDVAKGFDNINFEISGVDKNAESSNFGEFVIIEKLFATKGAAAKNELVYDKLTVLSEGKSEKLGSTFASLSQKASSPADFTGAKLVEFDVYIQNFAAFKTLMGEKGISNISLCLSSNGDSSKNSVSADILDRITQDGWNHLAISLNSFTKGDAVGTFDLTSVDFWSLLYNGDSTAQTGLLEGQITAVKNITAVTVEDPKLPENADPVISEEGKEGVYGNTYKELVENSRIELSAPVDITNYNKVQFDFYVDDYKAFKKMLDNASNSLRFGLGTSSNKANGRALYEFTNQVISQGWNRIELDRSAYTKQSGDSNPDFKTVYNAFLTFGDDTNTNTYGNIEFKIKNICSVPHERDIVPEAPEHVVKIWDGMTSKWGNQYVSTKLTIQKKMLDAPINIDDADIFEFDIYIENYEAFIEAAEIGELCFIVGSNNDMNKNIAVYECLASQVTHQGWNHIVIKKTSHGINWSANFKAIKWVYLCYWSSAVQNTPNPIGNTLVRIANVVGTHAEYRKSPALPNNVVSVLGDENGPFFAGNTVGQKYHFTLDRIYKQRFQPIDFSFTNKIEFDVYVDDYEKFLAAENDPNDNRNSKLCFELSATPPSLWDQYSAPRHYFSSAVYLAEHIKHSGWNHVVVSKQDFTTVNNNGVDWSAITAFLCFYRGSSNVYPVNNAYSDLYVRVGNICNTGIVANVPKDGNKAAKPDKSAVYISTADGVADEVGVWTTMGGYITSDYKTEGNGSIHQQVDYTETIDNTKMLYIFDETVDMSDIETLKFDYFIDIPGHIQRPGNKIEILLGNDRFARDNYYSWNLDIESLKTGWNSIELPISKAKVVGSPDLETVKVAMLRFTEMNLDSEGFAVIVYGIDNLRYISATGNKILKVEGWDENSSETLDDYVAEDEDAQIDTDFEIIEDEETENAERIETIVNKTGKVKYNKIREKTTVMSYTAIIIMLVIEAVVIVAGLVVFTIFFEKKSKKRR